MAPSTTAKEVFDQLTGYLLVHNAVFNDPRIPGLVQWLLFNRQGNEWKSTKASAAAI